MRRPTFIPPWLIPRPFRSGGLIRSSFTIARHFFRDYGWLRSFREGKCVDRTGLPIPWFTYPAVDFLSGLDLCSRTIFEYGSGASTLFWASRAKSVVSIENDAGWHERVRTAIPANVELVLAGTDVEEFAGAIRARGQFDVIVVDGLYRPRCCELALEHVAPGGIVVLDNSDQWLKSAAILRNGGLIQIDFTGFSPLNIHAHCTSIFLTRDYNFQPTEGYQPHASVAQPWQPWPND
jgi:Methyltransferase domain